ncbi:hypothetical protein CA599_11030 [Paenibacillus taichungensis]|nr:hypothetical protein CA599_11030 [Paenibacillus taichungensis]
MVKDIDEVLTKEEIEEAKRDEMRELLIEAFDDKSLLYEIYKKRGWLDRLFTDKILSMDREALYTSNQVADLCETHNYVIKNKRRELLEYVNPTQMGEGNSKTYKHNYISVFKMKMIHGLTGEGSEYTLPQLKEIITGTVARTSSTQQGENNNNELLLQIYKKLERFEQFEEMIKSNEFFEDIEKKVRSSSEKYLLADANKDQEAKEAAVDIYERIVSPNTSIADKELIWIEYNSLENKYPNHAYTIRLYKTAAEEKIIRFKQDEKELQILDLKQKVNNLFEEYDTARNESERETVRAKIRNVASDHPELSFEIRMWLSTAGQQKKGFFKRFFSSN